MKYADLHQSASRAAQFLRLLANENRLAILCALGEGERSVGELAAELDTSQPNVSQHLAKLRALDLVASRRRGTTVLYALRDRDAAAVIDVLYQRYCAAPTRNKAARRRAA